ncbi:hypothetical protein SteCoe_4061 [Stentor coeruleus]|uniref:EF-hand domain-containing protein n=1 Tax=Stentor coeruleus TaxID=5963 RepID=A0A1R2CVF4_9CILI|nr:hypothetical protein SteCoe_4061 [Stentor coeruleus]
MLKPSESSWMPSSHFITFKSLDKSLQRTIVNAYSLLDYDKDGIVSISDLKNSCKLSSEDEATYLLKSIKNVENIPNESLSFEEFFSGILEFPSLLSQFSYHEAENNQDASVDSVHLSIKEDDDVNSKLCEVITVISLIVKSYHNCCKYFTIEDLLETLHELLIKLKLKYKKNSEKRDMTRSIIFLYTALKLQNVKYAHYKERTEKKIEELEHVIHRLNKKYEKVAERNQDYLSKIIHLEKSLTKTINELDIYKKSNMELSTRCSNEESEELTKSSLLKKELEIVEQRIKKFLTLNMFIENQRKNEPQHKKKQGNKSYQFQYTECLSDPEKSHHIFILNEQLKKNQIIIKEKDEENKFLIDMITDLRQQIDDLNEEKRSWENLEKFVKFHQNLGNESDSSFISIRETLEIGCIDFSFKSPTKGNDEGKDYKPQVNDQDERIRNSFLFWMI